MDISAAHTLYDALAGDRSSFLYSGAFPDDHTARLIALGEAFLNGQTVRRDELNRLSFVMVEAYQNIIRHRARDMAHDPHEGRSMFLLRCEEDAQHILAINPVCRKETASLKDMLERLEGLDRSQLKELFLRGLQAQGPGKRGGAGLGLIEMARRSGHALQHALRPLDEQLELFALNVTLSERTPSDADDLERGMRAHAAVVANGIVMAHTGRIPSTAQETVLRIMESEVGASGTAVSRAYLAAIEHLTAHSVRMSDTMVVFSRVGTRDVLIIGQVVNSAIGSRTTSTVDAITGMDTPRLSHAYREGLLKRAQGGEQESLGLLELARHTSAPLEHRTDARADGQVFLAIKAVI